MSEKIKDPGVGKVSSQFAERMVNTNGSFNITYLNKSRRFSEAYNYLVNISWGQFFILTFAMGFVINAFFAVLYMAIGINEIAIPTGSLAKDFTKAFFFSSQTFTTVGYGAMAPKGVLSGLLSSVEAFLGLVIFAFVTGLLYGRFSKPRPAIRFSKNIILRDFKQTKAVMFKIVNNRKSLMINPKVTVTLSLTKQNKTGEYINDFYTLDLERKAINYLPTTWTIVHEIDKGSPLFEFSKTDLAKQHGELLIMISYYDESFNQEVHQMHSYTLDEIKLDYKFKSAHYFNSEGKLVLDYKLFDNIIPLKS